MCAKPCPEPSAGDRRGAWRRRRPPSPHHHGLQHCEVRQKHVVLHDVTGHLAEGPQISWPPINQDLPLHPRLPAGRMVGDQHRNLLEHSLHPSLKRFPLLSPAPLPFLMLTYTLPRCS